MSLIRNPEPGVQFQFPLFQVLSKCTLCKRENLSNCRRRAGQSSKVKSTPSRDNPSSFLWLTLKTGQCRTNSCVLRQNCFRSRELLMSESSVGNYTILFSWCTRLCQGKKQTALVPLMHSLPVQQPLAEQQLAKQKAPKVICCTNCNKPTHNSIPPKI